MNINTEYKAESKVIKGLTLKIENKIYSLERDGELITANARGFNTLVKLFNDDFIDELVNVHHWLDKKKCAVCGKTFYRTLPTVKGMFCSEECKRYHRNTYARQREKEEKQKRKNEKKKSKHLDEEIDKARELGLSYGQYKARKYIEEMEKIKVE